MSGGHNYSGIDYRASLNDEQYAAVTAPPGPALVLAGAGSGKTRTLTYRVAWLLDQGVRPWEILLLTFTNKAAREMLERVGSLTGADIPHWGGTFHSIGARVLRLHGSSVGLEPTFTILDAGDAESLLQETIREEDPAYLKNKDNPKAKPLAHAFSYARNTFCGLAEAIDQFFPWAENSGLVPTLVGFHHAYTRRKRERMITDYDDLLELWLQLLNEDQEIRDTFQRRFQHILVDEYQDTNQLQSRIIDTLASRHQVMAVGDDAQCIYTWRGADFENIISFPERHPGTQVYKIEKNYRSCPEILRLANGILANQPLSAAYGKELKAVREPNQRPFIVPAIDSTAQARFVLNRIRCLIDEGFCLAQIGILYRAHFQALELQMELSRSQIPYVITSGMKFFEQAHVRDFVAQLRWLVNPTDTPAWERFTALLPKVGPKTAQRLLALLNERAHKVRLSNEKARHAEVSLFAAPAPPPAQPESLIAQMTDPAVIGAVPADARETWKQMAQTFKDMENAYLGREGADRSPERIVQIGIEGWYEDYLRTSYPNWQSRAEDLNSLVEFAAKHETMVELLAQLTLLNSETGENAVDPSTTDCLRLTTIHQAKGLEYPVVFVIGLSEGLFPLQRTIEEGDLDEERRLFYVAATRAMDELYLCYPRMSLRNGSVRHLDPSRFLQEIPGEHYEIIRLRQDSW